MVALLAAALRAKGIEGAIVTLRDPHSPDREFPPGVRYEPCGNALVPRLGIPSSPAIVSTLAREVRDADLVHLHELWHVPQTVGGLIAQAERKPYLVSPHGALDPHSLAFYRGLKRISWTIFQRRILERAGGIHVLTDQEAADTRAAGVTSPTRTIPNGVDVERIRAMAAVEPESVRMPPGPYLVFMGRIDPRKGLDVLLQGFAEVAAERHDLNLLLAGSDTVGFWPALAEQARELGIEGRVSYVGYLNEPFKFQLLARAELFVLPSISEGMSMALLEALACGVPSLVTTRCNMPEVETAGAGRVVEPTARSLRDAMMGALSDETSRRAMGANATRLARDRFSIGRMAEDMARFYASLLATAAKSDFA